MARQVGIALAGLGLVGRRHAAAIASCDRVRLAAVADPRDEARQHAAELGVPHYSEFDQLLELDDVDGIIVGTPTLMHAEQGIACMAAGMPALVEKPIAVTVVEGQRLVDAAAEHGTPLLVGHHRRHNPLIARARQAIDEGAIGRIRGIQATCWMYKPEDYFEAAPWRKQKGAGPISINLAHDIDTLRYLCGEVVAVRSVAVAAVRGYENEDVAAAVLELDNSALATISVSDAICAPWSWELTADENPAYHMTGQSCCMIGGSLGSLSLPDMQLWRCPDEPHWWAPMAATRLAYTPADPLVNQLVNFADVISGAGEPLVTGQEGLETLKVVEMIAADARR